MVDVHQKFIYALVLSFFLCMSSITRLDFTVSAKTITVPFDFPTIQAAINNAAPGDTIFVHKGVYIENVVVNKSISILGESKTNTIIDGWGSGVVVKIAVNNVNLSGFTVQNSGLESHESGILVESHFNSISGNIVAKNGLTGVYLNNSFGSQLFENIIEDNGGYGALFIHSSNNNFSTNFVERNNGGVSLYSSNENDISRNVITYDQLGGINLVYSSKNSLCDNVVRYNHEYGLNLDYSSDSNTVTSNVITDNARFGLVLGSVCGNVLRNNSMINNQFNFHAVLARPNLQDYLNDVDSSNTVNGKEIYYLINSRDLTISPKSHPDAGYLALVNSTKISIEGFNFTENGQALLLAFTSNSSIENLEASNNYHGIQLCSSSLITIRNCSINNSSAHGITIDHASSDNTLIENVIANNTLGIRMVHSCKNNTITRNSIEINDVGVSFCSYNDDNMVTYNVVANNHIGMDICRVSPTKVIGNTIANNNQGLILGNSGNIVIHNNFVNNTIQASTPNYTSIWDLGYSNGGNYWSNYKGEDVNGDRIGDTSHFIDEYNVDCFPLMNFWTNEDEEPPAIGVPTSLPSDEVQPYEEVSVYVAAADVESGLKNVTLFYTIDNGTSWGRLEMVYNFTSELFMVVLPGQPLDTLMKYNIVAFDNAGHVTVKDNYGQLFYYEVIPEFRSMYILLLFLVTTIIVLSVTKMIQKNDRLSALDVSNRTLSKPSGKSVMEHCPRRRQ